jgi:hypothetical protein
MDGRIMAKNFKDLISADPKTMTREQAMIYVINFFNSRMGAMSKNNVDKAKDLIGLHEISVSELINKYVELVYKNS